MSLLNTVARAQFEHYYGPSSGWKSVVDAFYMRMWAAIVRHHLAYTRSVLSAINDLGHGVISEEVTRRGIILRPPKVEGNICYFLNGRYGYRRSGYVMSDELGGVSAWNRVTFSVHKEYIDSELSNPAKAKALNSFKPMKGFLRRTREVSIQAFIQELKLYSSEKECKTAADRICAALVPPVLKYAITPEDFYTMYSSGPSSCMSVKDAEGNHIHKLGLVGPSWYAFHPHTKGAYIADANGAVLARTILYEGKDKTWSYGRIYGNSNSLKLALAREGIKHAVSSDKLPPECEFTSPAYASPGASRRITPTPYFDNFPGDYVAFTYDDDANVFKWYVGNRAKYFVNELRYTWYQSSTQGYRTDADCHRVYKCDCCGRMKDGGSFRIPGAMVRICSKECVEKYTRKEYTVGISRAGTQEVCLRSDTVDSVEGTTYVSSLAIQERAHLHMPRGSCSIPEAGTEMYTDTAPRVSQASKAATKYPITIKIQRNFKYCAEYNPAAGLHIPKSDNPFGDMKTFMTYKVSNMIQGSARMPKPKVIFDEFPISQVA